MGGGGCGPSNALIVVPTSSLSISAPLRGTRAPGLKRELHEVDREERAQHDAQHLSHRRARAVLLGVGAHVQVQRHACAEWGHRWGPQLGPRMGAIDETTHARVES
jgi:hypothetical protein